jgi:hypothetical protein
MLCIGFNAVETIMLGHVGVWWFIVIWFNQNRRCSILVPVWECNIWCGPLLQHLSFKISFGSASNAMDQMLFCCISVFQYFSIICQCGVSADAFPKCCNAYYTLFKLHAFLIGRLFHMSSSRSLPDVQTRWVMTESLNQLMLEHRETTDRGV